MAKVADAFVGAVFGKLTVIRTYRKDAISKYGGPYTAKFSDCLCDCGNSFTLNPSNLCEFSSCGCAPKRTKATHGLSHTPTYQSWKDMITRTTNPNCPFYPLYKDRKPPESWKLFANFLADMGECPKGLTLERVDNSKAYSPENCVWLSLKEQQHNKTNSVRVLYRGRLRSILELSDECDVGHLALRYRLEHLWSAEDAVNLPRHAKPFSYLKESALQRLYPK